MSLVVEFENNRAGQPPVEVEVEFAEDEGPFVSLTVSMDGRTIVDAFLTDEAAVQKFFDDVSTAWLAFFAAGDGA